MKIIGIFAIVNESLYAVKYEKTHTDEFSNLFRLWNDAEYLSLFFEEHKADLQSRFWGQITINEAIIKTRKEANLLEKKLIQIAQNGKTDRLDSLSTLFKPLHDRATKIEEFEKSKAKGIKNSWLRIYAIRIDINLFVVSGGAIKLTETMNERAHLLTELQKLEITRKYLQEYGGDENDFNIVELY